jgi:hypothetical protein
VGRARAGAVTPTRPACVPSRSNVREFDRPNASKEPEPETSRAVEPTTQQFGCSSTA